MDLLFLNNYNYLRGGSERIFLGEMEMLKKPGHTVAVFARKSPQDDDSQYSQFFTPDIETASLRISWSTLMTVKEIIYSNTVKKALKAMLAHVQPDLAHAHNIYGRLTTSVLDVLAEAGVPTIMTLHDMKLLCPSYLMLNHGRVCEKCKGGRYYNAVITKCHKDSYAASAIYAFEAWRNHVKGKYDSVKYFIAPSKFLLEKHIEFGHCRERFIHIPSFINTDSITPSFEDGKHLLYFGRLSAEKGINTLLKAFGRLKSDIPLLVVGDGPDRNELEGLNVNNVQFTGYLQGNALFDAIANAVCVVIPSECYENSPLSVLEAMAFGKPVIGSRIGGIPELIDEHETGLLFEPGNVEDLGKKLETMLGRSKNAINKMGRAARHRVERKYSAERHYRRLLKAYEKTIVAV